MKKKWDKFKDMDLKRIKKLLINPVIIDGHNIFNPKILRKMGFIYKSMGRP